MEEFLSILSTVTGIATELTFIPIAGLIIAAVGMVVITIAFGIDGSATRKQLHDKELLKWAENQRKQQALEDKQK